MFRPKLFSSLRGYNRQLFSADLLSGITIGIVALPLAMAFAIASGLSPEKGVFTAIVAGFLISFLGGSNVQIGGPTGAFVIIVSSITLQYGYEGLIYATIIAGVILIILGFSKMGNMIKFIPFPVTTGFTTGIALIIFSTQIKDLFGLTITSIPVDFLSKWHVYFKFFHTINFSATFISVLTIVIILITKKLFPRLPNMLFGMLISTAIVYFFHLDVETVGSRFGNLPRLLPAPSLPSLGFEEIKHLISPAFTIAMLAAIESLLSATVADGMTGERHLSNTELIAQGVANLGSAFFGGMPATGAIARTATNIKSGGKTPVAGIIHAITLAIILLFFAPLAKLIPLATLSAILAIVSYNMSEWRNFISLFRAPRSDVTVLMITFLLTVLIDLTVAVEIGLILAAILFIRRMSEVSNVEIITNELNENHYKFAEEQDIMKKKDISPGIEIYEINGPFFFGAADKFKEISKVFDHSIKIIILRMRNVPAIDATGIYVLKEMLIKCHKDSIHLILSGVHHQPRLALKKYGLRHEIGVENICSNIDNALERAEQILTANS